MGRKQKLKLQRRIEEKNEFTTRKEKNNKLIIGIIFLVLILFAAWQISIALNKNKDEGNIIVEDSIEKNDDVKINKGDMIEEEGELVNEENKQDNINSQDSSTRSMEPTDVVLNQENKIVLIETNKGDIKLELYMKDAPKTVENFVKLASENFYDGIKFHRVMSDFMIQTGDPLSKDDNPANDGTGGPGYSFEDEINSHKVEVGSLAMANSGPNTNGSQFFIVTKRAQPHLDGKHTVFGKVLEGMNVVTSIEQGDVMNKVYIIK